MEDLRSLLACVRILVAREGNAECLGSEHEKARYEGLKDQPLQQTLYSNVIAARSHGNKSGLGIRLHEEGDVTSKERQTAAAVAKVEDVFLELAFDILPKIVACLVVLHRNCEKRHQKQQCASSASSSSTPSVAAAAATVPELPSDSLAPADSDVLYSLLQFVVSLGVHPFLWLRLRGDAARYTSAGRRASPLDTRQRMMTAVGYLRCLREHHELLPLLRRDAVHCAAMCVLIEQVVWSAPGGGGGSGAAAAAVESSSEQELHAVMKRQARVWLDELVDAFPHPDLVSQLLYLQHVATLPSRVTEVGLAGEFQDECEKLILGVAMKPGCLVHVLESVMRTRKAWTAGPEINALYKQLALMLSRGPLRGLPPAEYFDSVVRQLVDITAEGSNVGVRGLVRLAAIVVLAILSHTDMTVVAYQQYVFTPISVLYDEELANRLPVLSKTFLGDVIVTKADVERSIKVINDIYTFPSSWISLKFRLPSNLPIIAQFFMGSTMPVRSQLRRRVLETLSAYVQHHADPVSQLLVLLESPESALVPSTAYISTQGHMVRSHEPEPTTTDSDGSGDVATATSPGGDEPTRPQDADLSGDSRPAADTGDEVIVANAGDSTRRHHRRRRRKLPWRNETRDIWPPATSLINPSFVHVMDLMVQRRKEPNSPILAGSSAKHESDGSLAADVTWTRNCAGANIVSSVLARCLSDLTRSLNGRPDGWTKFLEPGADVEPHLVNDVDGDFVRLNLVAMASERYGPDILPRTADVMAFAAQGLASAAYCLDPGKMHTRILEKGARSAGRGRIVAHFNCWVVNVFPATVWALVSVQLCLALLSHLLESEDKYLDPDTIRRLMAALRVIGNSHPDQHIRQHCLEVQIAASTYTTMAAISKTEWDASTEFVSSQDLEKILSSLQEQEEVALSTLGPHIPDILKVSDNLVAASSSRAPSSSTTTTTTTSPPPSTVPPPTVAIVPTKMSSAAPCSSAVDAAAIVAAPTSITSKPKPTARGQGVAAAATTSSLSSSSSSSPSVAISTAKPSPLQTPASTAIEALKRGKPKKITSSTISKNRPGALSVSTSIPGTVGRSSGGDAPPPMPVLEVKPSKPASTMASRSSSSPSPRAQPSTSSPAETIRRSTSLASSITVATAATGGSSSISTSRNGTSSDSGAGGSGSKPHPVTLQLSLAQEAAVGLQYKSIMEELELDKLAEQLSRLPGEMAAETEHIRSEVEEFTATVDAAMSRAMGEALSKLSDVPAGGGGGSGRGSAVAATPQFGGRLATIVDGISELGTDAVLSSPMMVEHLRKKKAAAASASAGGASTSSSSSSKKKSRP